MSSRQMRRLQDLVDRATGLDADDEEDDVATTLPATVQPKKSADRHSEKKKAKKEKRKTAVPESGAPETAPTPTASQPPAKVVSSPPTATAAAGAAAAEDWEEVEDDDHATSARAHASTAKESTTGKRKGTHAVTDEDANEAAARTAAQAEEEKRRKKEERKKLRQQQQRQMQAEEDALLDAVLATHPAEPQSSTGAGDGAMGSAPGSPNSSAAPGAGDGSAMNANAAAGASPTAAAAEAASFAHFVMACDAQHLDTRLERIRLFGVDAVEDVGDGRTPHRRADGRLRDTGTVSFFPAHHLHVKFAQSAFATPNRYRWGPYDSLGIYLSTEEVQSGSGGGGSGNRTGLEYTLNCESNAFQRALQMLEACTERMGGVHELIECLSRNKVYHIPTLLQCVYAMEATGESTFATELLEVALYQLGIILRRFTLSGTWAQRRLPMLRGGNALLFHVLQRGVHAALKRGCLRTAFERARCLLSFDPADPCGVLLLLDYTALRAKRWVWLLEMRQRLLEPLSIAAAAGSGGGFDAQLARSIALLPNYAFSWALARHFIDREEQLQGGGDVSGGRPSKVLRGITPAQRDALAATPPAQELLVAALTRFPHAAVRLVNALGGVEAVCSGEDFPLSDASVWFGDIVVCAEDTSSGDVALQQSHLASLFVARHVELWKLKECISVLRTGVSALMQTPKAARTAAEGTAAVPDSLAYVSLSEEAVLGVSVAPIPAELLRPEIPVDGVEGMEEGVGMNPDMVRELIRMLRDQGAGDDRAVAEQMARRLEQELVDGAGGAEGPDAVDAPAAAGGEDEHLDWYDYDDDDEDAVDYFSVASAEERASETEDPP